MRRTLLGPLGAIQKKVLALAIGGISTRAMPDTTTTAETQAAEVAAVPAQTPDGATPPKPAVATADKRMTGDEARRVLQSLKGGTPDDQIAQNDPLAEPSNGDDVLSNEGDTIADVLGYVPDESAAQDEPPAAEVDPVVETAPVDDPPAVELTDERVRTNINAKRPDGTFVNSERTRAALTLSHERKIDYEDAWTALFGERHPAAKTEPAQAEIDKPEPTPAEIDTQIKDLRVKRKEARDSINDALADELNDQINDLVLNRQEAVQREAQRQQAQRETQQTVEQQVQASIERALAIYPDAGKEGTPFYNKLQAEINRRHAAGDPVMQSTEWPEILSTLLGTRDGIAPKLSAQAAPAKPVVKPAAVAPKKSATPLIAPGSVSGATPAVSPVADWQARLEKAKASRDTGAVQQLMREAVTLEKRRAA